MVGAPKGTHDQRSGTALDRLQHKLESAHATLYDDNGSITPKAEQAAGVDTEVLPTQVETLRELLGVRTGDHPLSKDRGEALGWVRSEMFCAVAVQAVWRRQVPARKRVQKLRGVPRVPPWISRRGIGACQLHGVCHRHLPEHNRSDSVLLLSPRLILRARLAGPTAM